MSETRKDDDMLICERMGRCPTPIACSNPYECRDAKRAATPPTPDCAAVRETEAERALRELFVAIDYDHASEGVKMAGGRVLHFVRELALRPAPLPDDVREAWDVNPSWSTLMERCAPEEREMLIAIAEVFRDAVDYDAELEASDDAGESDTLEGQDYWSNIGQLLDYRDYVRTLYARVRPAFPPDTQALVARVEATLREFIEVAETQPNTAAHADAVFKALAAAQALLAHLQRNTEAPDGE